MAAQPSEPIGEVHRWLHSSSGRSKRTQIVNEGCYVLEHDATGRFYMGGSKSVSQTVDKDLALLATGKHPCKLLNGLYDRDNMIRVHEYPCTSKRLRKQLMQHMLDTQANDYLCLNPPLRSRK